MPKNGNKASIREVYDLIEDFRQENNNLYDKMRTEFLTLYEQTRYELFTKIDNLENNHIHGLTERMNKIENKIYWIIGMTAGIGIIMQIILKFTL